MERGLTRLEGPAWLAMMNNGHRRTSSGADLHHYQDSDDDRALSADDNDHDQDDEDSSRLGKRKRPLSVSYVVVALSPA